MSQWLREGVILPDSYLDLDMVKCFAVLLWDGLDKHASTSGAKLDPLRQWAKTPADVLKKLESCGLSADRAKRRLHAVLHGAQVYPSDPEFVRLFH